MYLRDMCLPSDPGKSTDRIEVLLVVFGTYGLHWLEASYKFLKWRGQVVEWCGYLVLAQCPYSTMVVSTIQCTDSSASAHFVPCFRT
jgi:hypothetical protein